MSAYDPEKCYVNGKIFNRVDQVSREDVKSPCKPACYCNKYIDNLKNN